MKNIQISKVGSDEVVDIQHYVMNFREKLFPMLDNTIWPKDIARFQDIYIDHPQGVFLQAKDSDGARIGVIGMMPYDYRFSYLDYKDQVTVEVARLFIEPQYRRSGLGSLLFEALLHEAHVKKIDMLYLHTHPFLTGAFEFWQRHGFDHIHTSIDNGQTTWHMERVSLIKK